ncbi:MAG: amidase family protein, partial [Nitrososphaerales archaeon]
LAHALTILSEMKSNMLDHGDVFSQLGPTVRISLALADGIKGTDYIKAQRVRTRALAAFDAAFAEVDAIITPATAITAPPIPGPAAEEGGWSNLNNTTELMRFVFPGNLTGLPAIAFPAGYDPAGLPIGMQAMGRHWEEHLLLRVACVAEQFVERRRPQVFYPIL